MKYQVIKEGKVRTRPLSMQEFCKRLAGIGCSDNACSFSNKGYSLKIFK